LLVALGVVLLGVAAWSASKATTGGSAPDVSANVPGNDAAQNDALLVALGALTAAVVFVVAPALLRSGRRRAMVAGDDDPRRPQLWVRLVGGVFFMLAVVYVIMLVARHRPDETQPLPVAQAPPETVQPQVGERSGAHGWTAFALVTAGAIAVVTAAVVLQRRGRGRGSMPDDFDRPPPQSPGPIDFEALAPGDAVRAAYAAARVALEPMGVPPRSPETPYEYLDRVREDAPTAERPLATLTRLFEVARFSHHPVTPAMKADAIAAYQAITHEVAVFAAARADEAARAREAAQARDQAALT